MFNDNDESGDVSGDTDLRFDHFVFTSIFSK